MAEQKPDEDQVDEAAPGDAHETGTTGAADALDASDGMMDAAESLDAQIEQLQIDLEGARELALRAQADAQNIKRRAEQDVEKARKFALERFCSELLPVVDNLERALDAATAEGDSIKPFTEGVELTLKSFLDALRKFQIEPLEPAAGEPFDPQVHQAMSMIESPDAEPNTVLMVMQKGYTLNQRLVRPAMVMVSKAPSAS